MQHRAVVGRATDRHSHRRSPSLFRDRSADLDAVVAGTIRGSTKSILKEEIQFGYAAAFGAATFGKPAAEEDTDDTNKTIFDGDAKGDSGVTILKTMDATKTGAIQKYSAYHQALNAIAIADDESVKKKIGAKAVRDKVVTSVALAAAQAVEAEHFEQWSQDIEDTNNHLADTKLERWSELRRGSNKESSITGSEKETVVSVKLATVMKKRKLFYFLQMFEPRELV